MPIRSSKKQPPPGWGGGCFFELRIGGVAGNAKVGNRHNLVTRWQSVEYVTAQNLERRALARFDAIMVVPGAVGAWRRSALDSVGGYRLIRWPRIGP